MMGRIQGLLHSLLPLALLTLSLAAEKKIELQDIEEDNLKSEKAKALEDEQETNRDDSDESVYADLHKGSNRMVDYLGNGLVRVYEEPTEARYVQQYAVTEQGNEAAAPQTMLMPLRLFYNVPQYIQSPAQHADHPQPAVHYVEKSNLQPVSVEAVDERNYVDYPTYIAQSIGGIVSHIPVLPRYAAQVRYLAVNEPTHPSGSTSGHPPNTYVTSHPTPILPAPAVHTQASVTYETQYSDKSQNEILTESHSPNSNNNPYAEKLQSANDHARKYNQFSRQRMPSSISELPRPTSLLYDPQPPHLAGLPKILSMYNNRPLSQPIYSHIAGNLGQYGAGETPYMPHYQSQPIVPKRRPYSLLDSYVPSGLQLEYLNRGLTKDALSTYDAIVHGNKYPGQKHRLPFIKHFEKGFLPNQMYHTAAGGVTFGHYKRTPKSSVH